FFCQAEDGIRDWSVTGVQTCALPILIDRGNPGEAKALFLRARALGYAADSVFIAAVVTGAAGFIMGHTPAKKAGAELSISPAGGDRKSGVEGERGEEGGGGVGWRTST